MSAAAYGLDFISKLLDLTPQRVTQLVNEGIIPRKERGRYELVPVVQAYIKYLRERSLKSDVHGDDYNAHRTRLTKAKADLAEMEKAQIEEQLIPADDVERVWIEVSQNMRQKLLALPQRAAPECYAAEKLVEVKAILKEQVYDALQEIAEIEVKVSEPIRASDSDTAGQSNAGSDKAAARPQG
jgi:phage terminase Nu1 subunit (DNA packaging protein)